MQSAPYSSKSTGTVSAVDVLFFFLLLLFLIVVCVWPIVTWRLHHFSTWTPSAAHPYAVRDHGGVVYVSPRFGKFYVSLPWLWGGLLAATVLAGLLPSKKSGSGK
jgi:hypothetical protein